MKRLSAVLVALLVVAGTVVAWPESASSGISDVANSDMYFLLQSSDGFSYEVHRADRHGNVDRVHTKGAFGRASVSRDGNFVAFSGFAGQGDSGRYLLYVMRPDGTGLDQLTGLVGADLDPAWSPNGKQIAFSRDASGGNLNPNNCCDIVVIDADGTDAEKVDNTVGGINPSWSPDGDSLVFETPNGIYTIDSDGSNRENVAPAGAREPAWSPSGDEIAYVRATSSSETTDELVILDLDSSSEEVRFSIGSRIESPTWVGDSIYIVTYNGWGYDGRASSRLRVVHHNGDNTTVFNPAAEMVFASQTLNQCHGMSVGGGIGGGSGVEGHSAPGDCMGFATASGDFNRDGFMDVATGVPGDREQGAVNVLYGSAGGLTISGDHYFDQTLLGAGTAEPGDRFGEALAVGDFDDDGFDDLAVGAPGEDVGGEVDAGAVNIIYGSPSGLGSSGAQIFHQDSSGVGGTAEADDRFGESLASGDLDDNGNDDLVIGVPGEGVGGSNDAGAIGVLLGSGGGLSSTRSQTFNQSSSGIKGGSQTDDRWGESLAVADIDRDGHADVLIGVPGEDVDGKTDAGAIHVIFGAADGLTNVDDQRFSTASSGVLGGPQNHDLFGHSVALGDIDGDGHPDAVVGSPGEDVGGENSSGAISVLYGTPNGLTSAGDQRFNENTSGVNGTSEEDDRFGSSVAIGDINDDGRMDVVVGVPGEGVNGEDDAGSVNVLYGTPSGLSATGDQRFTEDTGGISGNSETDDRFGFAVFLADIDGDDNADLVIGSPGEGVTGDTDAGSFSVIYGTNSGLTTSGDDRFTQDS